MPIHWRSQTDIAEENRFGSQPDPDRRVTEVTDLKCKRCGMVITELMFASGRRSYSSHGVRSVEGDGVYCRMCPDVRDEDLRHDADPAA